MMARNANVPFKGRIQKRKNNHLQIITFGLQRAAGPYSRATSGLMHCSKTACYSITSSARASSVGGTSRPSASSNLVGCCTGRSAGFSPLSMRLT
jgi:hypothetical protein